MSLEHETADFSPTFWECLTILPGATEITKCCLYCRFKVPVSEATRAHINATIRSHVRIKPWVNEEVEKFYQTNMAGSFVIGIHLRGTDKVREVRPVSPHVLTAKALEEAKNSGRADIKFFIASDEQELIDVALADLVGFSVVMYDAERSHDKNPLHLSAGRKPAQHGFEALVEALLLSKCNVFVHTISNFSAAVLGFNLELKNISCT